MMQREASLTLSGTVYKNQALAL